MINFECIKEITRALKSNFKGMQVNSYGYCCGSDYDSKHKYINYNDYVCAKIYKGGLNNDYHNGQFELGNTIYYIWHLTDFELDKVLKTMQNVASKYGYTIMKPIDKMKSIALVDNMETYMIREYENIIYNCKDKEQMKEIVKTMFEDKYIEDLTFTDLIYDNVIPKLTELGVNMDYNEKLEETSYERVLKENY